MNENGLTTPLFTRYNIIRRYHVTILALQELQYATLYTILGKFEKEQYITQVEMEGRKRTYAITAKGRAAYEAELARLRQCVADAEGGTTP